MTDRDQPAVADLFIIGGGINGCGIARDAVGRGLSVALAEQGDLAQATSSASTKLFHGGLRYLEYFKIRLVRESLREREVLLAAMPHISWPMRFVLPYSPAMRFDSDTPTARLLAVFLPWMKGRRPAWLIRLGLFLYDHMGGRRLLPGTRKCDLRDDPAGAVLRPGFDLAYEYSDCWVQDARLVLLNARDAQARGAQVMVRTKVVAAHREGGLWCITTEGGQGRQTHHARVLVNAAGPWVEEVLHGAVGAGAQAHVRLVRGSHIVTRRLFAHERCYFFQGEDGRICFAIPFEDDFTLIGTTDQPHQGAPGAAVCSPEEVAYLCAFASKYFARPVTPEDVVWTYSGVRPLYDDGASSATAATRDYVLTLDAEGAPLLSVFGGKITTYRRLAETVLARLAPYLPGMGRPWTAGVAMPGGAVALADVAAKIARMQQDYPFLTAPWARRLWRAYGTEAWDILGAARRAEDLGRDFGATLTLAELRWMVRREWAQSGEDVLWRRSKLGLRLDPAAQAAVADCVAGLCAEAAADAAPAPGAQP